MNRFRQTVDCQKCGSSLVDAKWCPQGPPEKGATIILPERIERICSRCRYSWWEAPLDSKEAAPRALPDELVRSYWLKHPEAI